MNQELLLSWEQKQLEREHERYEPTKKRRAFDPCKERIIKRRTREGWFLGRENKYHRKETCRAFTMKVRDVYDEVYYRPVPHDYKTYGWETW